MRPYRTEIMGVPVDCVTPEGAVRSAEQMLHGNRPHTIFAVNPEKILRARKDPKLLVLLRGTDLLIPDGMGVVWAARLHGAGRLTRVPGADLMPALCALAARVGVSVFLLGAKPEVNTAAVKAIERQFPGLRVAGAQHGYFSAAETPAVVERINASGAAMLFVAMGSPRQEEWINAHLPRLTSVRICQGVGGTFDVLAGAVSRAPVAFQKLGLEWAYRDLRPRRLARALPKLEFGIRALLRL
jgi:N-acetylglucosaminyldiphosphoundecaprenol N-acetyl-beta-D-mannosaminyltransferase